MINSPKITSSGRPPDISLPPTEDKLNPLRRRVRFHKGQSVGRPGLVARAVNFIGGIFGKQGTPAPAPLLSRKISKQIGQRIPLDVAVDRVLSDLTTSSKLNTKKMLKNILALHTSGHLEDEAAVRKQIQDSLKKMPLQAQENVYRALAEEPTLAQLKGALVALKREG